VGKSSSASAGLRHGVPQGSVLGPVLFSAYVTPLTDITQGSGTSTHQYADDDQQYITFKPRDMSSVTASVESIENCIVKISDWMASNKLKLSNSKTELLVFTPPRIQHSIPPSQICVGDAVIQASAFARNLGCVWDSAMTMEAHVKSVCSSCFYHLHNISAIRASLTKAATEKLVHALITSRLDSCNALLLHLPKCLTKKLQRVQNTAARIIMCAPRHSSISSILQELHWLPIIERIEFKICTLTWKALNKCAPNYITELLTPYTPARTLRSGDQMLLSVPKCRVNYGERAFCIAAPKLWNSLPLVVRHHEHYDAFKVSLKTHLFRKAYRL
jgi:hypothetical protein